MMFERPEHARYFILDGVDGAGKSTQVGLLGNFLFTSNRRYTVVLTREPTYRVHGIKARQLLQQDKDHPEAHQEEALTYFVKDREDHLLNRVMPALHDGATVIQDRGKYSTVAYQGAQGIVLERILQEHKGMIVPDAVVILNLPLEETLRRRRASRLAAEKFEQQAFQEQVWQYFQRMKEIFPGERIFYVDGIGTPADVHARIVAVLRPFFPFPDEH